MTTSTDAWFDAWIDALRDAGHQPGEVIGAGMEGTVVALGDERVAKLWLRRTPRELALLRDFYTAVARRGRTSATGPPPATGPVPGSRSPLRPSRTSFSWEMPAPASSRGCPVRRCGSRPARRSHRPPMGSWTVSSTCSRRSRAPQRRPR